MLTITPPGASSADEMAALLGGVRLLDDAFDTLTQVRIELSRLIADSHWRADAVEILRASLIERRREADAHSAEVVAHRDDCLRGIT
ncbi:MULTISPECIES: hypothetical protein [unclassified Microbacterium]|uniref:hypothetical protein n=1 Tax=unclassified Microbacterium TaxID=2609290 RepID=UPI0008FCA0E6|nr:MULTISPECIES: hypothetical protein [unclassified Microbacterium]OIU88472.1 hypothetical protein BFN01_04680 [Microbacterium sp. AR7-10]